MEFLIVNHGKQSKTTGAALDVDGALSAVGLTNVCKTAVWVSQNVNTKGFIGYTSPYLCALQTASIISDLSEIPFFVNDDLREFSTDPVKIEDRSIMFQNLNWDYKVWDGVPRTMPLDDIQMLIQRCKSFLDSMKGEKVIVVTHSTVAIVLANLSSGKTQKQIVKAYNTNKESFSQGMKPCGLTIIQNNDPVWFTKIVHPL